MGADWGLTDSRGAFTAMAYYQFQTDNGANIFVYSTGTNNNGTGLTHISLETGSEDYYWVNDIAVLGAATPGEGFITIDAWQFSPARCFCEKGWKGAVWKSSQLS